MNPVLRFCSTILFYDSVPRSHSTGPRFQVGQVFISHATVRGCKLLLRGQYHLTDLYTHRLVISVPRPIPSLVVSRRHTVSHRITTSQRPRIHTKVPAVIISGRVITRATTMLLQACQQRHQRNQHLNRRSVRVTVTIHEEFRGHTYTHPSVFTIRGAGRNVQGVFS